MKPLNRKNYGSIPHLSSSKLGDGDHYISEGQEKILTFKKRDKNDEIFVFEKYDGSNVGVGKMNGQIYPLSRSGYEAKTSPYKQHHLFHDWVMKRLPLFDYVLGEGERITGEWLMKTHSIKYMISEKYEPIMFFDFFTKDNNRKPFDYLNDLGFEHGIQIPRLLHRGDSISPVDLEPALNECTDHIMPLGENPEGMVYRVERNKKVNFLAKWVRNDFEPGKYMKEDVWNVKTT